MTKPPKRIWAWPFNPGWGGHWRENPDAVKREEGGAVYVRLDSAQIEDAAAEWADAREACLQAALEGLGDLEPHIDRLAAAEWKLFAAIRTQKGAVA